jgi:hypothetical protein
MLYGTIFAINNSKEKRKEIEYSILGKINIRKSIKEI